MKITPVYRHQILSLPAEAVTERLASASKDELKVLLSVIADPEFVPAERAAALDVTEKAFLRALEAWKAAGVLLTDEEPSISPSGEQLTLTGEPSPKPAAKKKVLLRSTLPTYTADELSEAVEKTDGCAELIDSCQQILGRIFNTSETAVIVGLLDHLRLTPEYILLLCSHAASIHKTSIRYIEKMAVEFYDSDISSYGALEAELARREARLNLESFVRETFGTGSRALIKKERECIDRWANAFGFSRDMIAKAYEVTVTRTGKASMDYAHAVLENWYAAGYKTPEEVDAAEDARRTNAEKRPDGSSFDTDEFFEAALRRSYSIMDKNAKNGASGEEES
ncbi:MAG: DnaD domain protein [Clostridia bacterium]|nr:DnaD domain protein [Clostridia bacterium]